MPKGKLVLKKPYISINGVNLTTRISSITVDASDDEVDLSTFGSQWKETGVGLSDASFAATIFHDFNTSMVQATLWPLKSGMTKFVAIVKPEEGECKTENPAFMLCAQLFGYNPLGGGVGEASTTDFTMKNAASAGLLVMTTKPEEEAKITLLQEYAEGKK